MPEITNKKQKKNIEKASFLPKTSRSVTINLVEINFTLYSSHTSSPEQSAPAVYSRPRTSGWRASCRGKRANGESCSIIRRLRSAQRKSLAEGRKNRSEVLKVLAAQAVSRILSLCIVLSLFPHPVSISTDGGELYQYPAISIEHT